MTIAAIYQARCQAVTYCDLRPGYVVPTSEMFRALDAHGCGAIASFSALCDAVEEGDLDYVADENGRMGYRITKQAMERREAEVRKMVEGQAVFAGKKEE